LPDENVSRGESRGSSGDRAKWTGREATPSEAGAKVLEDSKDAVLETAEAQKSGGAHRLAGLSKAVHEAADDLGHEMPQAATYIHAMADRLDDASSSLRSRNIEEIVGTVSDLARKQPAASFVGALVAGFALSRFLKSTRGKEAAKAD
jgi:hypothetical protein